MPVKMGWSFRPSLHRRRLQSPETGSCGELQVKVAASKTAFMLRAYPFLACMSPALYQSISPISVNPRAPNASAPIPRRGQTDSPFSVLGCVSAAPLGGLSERKSRLLAPFSASSSRHRWHHMTRPRPATASSATVNGHFSARREDDLTRNGSVTDAISPLSDGAFS